MYGGGGRVCSEDARGDIVGGVHGCGIGTVPAAPTAGDVFRPCGEKNDGTEF